MAARSTTYERWVWHKTSSSSASACKKEFDKLPANAQGRLRQKMDRFRDGTYGPRDVDSLGDGILEIRVKLGSNPYRVLFFISGRVCVALTAFHKKDQQTSRRDVDRAKSRRATWCGE